MKKSPKFYSVVSVLLQEKCGNKRNLSRTGNYQLNGFTLFFKIYLDQFSVIASLDHLIGLLFP